MKPSSIAIVGASLAGLNAAAELRRAGYEGRLTIIGAEQHYPYDRPPLSKEILRQQYGPEKLWLAFDPAQIDAEWKLGISATGLEAAARRIHLDDGTSDTYDGIVIACGARPRPLPGIHLGGVHMLRTLDDALALRSDLAKKPSRMAVVGGGFIGQEVAASCRELGIEVTMVEANAPAQHVVGRDVALFLADMHGRKGVDVRLGASVQAIEGADRISGISLSNGEFIEAAIAVVGIGVIPNTDWLLGSGLEIGIGVICDRTCLAAPGIVAAGDICRWPNERYSEMRRVEHWDNAARQGAFAARRLLMSEEEAAEASYAPVPWFWSDQYGSKLQLVGSAAGHEEVHVSLCDREGPKVLALYRRGERMTAAFGINNAKSILKYRRLLEGRVGWRDALDMEPAN